jgi:hypothetical protein
MLIESAKNVKSHTRDGDAYEDMVKDVAVWWVACFVFKGLESNNTNQGVFCSHSKLLYLPIISTSLPICYSQIPSLHQNSRQNIVK